MGSILYVTTLVSNAITAGIGGGLYGVSDDTLRQQMAVFIHGQARPLLHASALHGPLFTDVPCSSHFAPWIECPWQNRGITGGCGGGDFCPQDPVRRDQMAVFLLKAEHGSSYMPPMCTGIFLDVPCPSTFANWIEQLSPKASPEVAAEAPRPRQLKPPGVRWPCSSSRRSVCNNGTLRR